MKHSKLRANYVFFPCGSVIKDFPSCKLLEVAPMA